MAGLANYEVEFRARILASLQPPHNFKTGHCEEPQYARCSK
jgi:hypothetical protein